MSVVSDLSVNPEMAEKKPNIVISVEDIADTIISNMQEAHSKGIKVEENPVNDYVYEVDERSNSDSSFQVKEEEMAPKSGVSVEKDVSEDSPVVLEKIVIDVDTKILETVDGGQETGTNSNDDKKMDTVENVASTTQNPSCSHENEMQLDMTVKTIKKRGRKRKEECAGTSSSTRSIENVESEVWETVEPSTDPPAGVRRSGRKRRQKKMFYMDLDDDNVDSYSNGNSDEEWNYQNELKNVKLEDEETFSLKFPPNKTSISRDKNKKTIKRKDGDLLEKGISSGKRGRKSIKERKEETPSDKEGNVKELSEEGNTHKQFSCKGCDVVFLSEIQFRNHRLTCKELKSFGEERLISRTKSLVSHVKGCPICYKKFGKRSAIKRHLALHHTNIVHINCAVCYKKIGDINDTFQHFLEEHQNSFSDREIEITPGNLACPVCGEYISKPTYVKQHLVNHHANLLNITCTICQRPVGSMLDYLQHFVRYHSHSSLTPDKNNEIVTTNTESVQKTKSTTSNEKTDTDNPSSITDESNVVCIQCNKSIANYKLLILHMLSHKIEENTNIVSKNLNMSLSSQANDSGDQNPNETTTGISEGNSIVQDDINSKPLDEYPLPVYYLPPDNLSTVHSVSGVLGPDLLISLNRSFNLMTEMSKRLNSELNWNEFESFSTREDLARRVNKILQFSSGITDVGKCMLLVLEECQQVKTNPYEDDHIPVDVEEEVSVSEDEVDDDVNNDDDDTRNELKSGIGDEDCNTVQNGTLSNEEGEVKADETMTTSKHKSKTKSASDNSIVGGECSSQDKENNVEDENDKQSNSKISKSRGKNIKNQKTEVSVAMDVGRRSSQRLREKTTKFSSSKVKKSKKNYICKICGRQLLKKSSLTYHMLTHSDARPFKCKKCTASFKAEEHLKRHILIHLNDSRFKCDFCPYSHRTMSMVQKHSYEAHPNEKLFSCDLCKHQSRTSHDLTIHKKIHTPKKCKHCDFEASHYYELKAHMRKTHQNRFCPHCSFTCTAPYQLTRHMKKHVKSEPDKIYCCELCGNTFDSKRKMDYHVLRHIDKKPLSCTLCDYRCSSKQSLESHMLKHSGLKPYKCDICGSAFRRSTYLKHHKLMHSDEKGFCCRYCGKGFKYKYNCLEHEMIHTGEMRHKCKLCNFACRRKKFLVQHLEEHKARGSDVESLNGDDDDATVVLTAATADDDVDLSNLMLKTEDLVPIL